MNKHLIITADDYGMSSSVNEAIEACLTAGAMRATCVMMNMPAYAPAATLRERFPQASVGIHWTLTQGQPVLPASQVPSLVDTDGQFHPFAQLRRKWLTKQIKRTEIEAELRAQYARFREVVGPPDFWNTHENAHVCPGLFETCVAIGLELEIPTMRSHCRIVTSYDNSSAGYNLRHPLFWLKGQVIAHWSDRAMAHGMRMPDGRLYAPNCQITQDTIEHIVKCLPWKSVKQAVELVIHPAIVIEEELFGSLTETRIREYRMFSDPTLITRLQQHGVHPVGFEVLRNEE